MTVIIAFILSLISFFSGTDSGDYTPNTGAFEHIVCEDDMPVQDIWKALISGECWAE